MSDFSRQELATLHHQAERAVQQLKTVGNLTTRIERIATAPGLPRIDGISRVSDKLGTFTVIDQRDILWPEDFFASREVKTARKMLKKLDGRTAHIEPADLTQLINESKPAAPSFFARLLGAGSRVADGQVAARRLESAVRTVERAQIDDAVAPIIARLDKAQEAARHGVDVFATDGVLSAEQRRVAQQAIRIVLGSTLSHLEPLDPAKVTQAATILDNARRTRSNPLSLEALRDQATEHLNQLTRRRGRTLLAAMEVERLREVTADRLRTEGLAEINITSVLDVLDAREHTLMRARGVGERSATRLKAAAETMLAEAAAASGGGKSIGDTRCRPALALLSVLTQYEHSVRLDDEQIARRNRIHAYATEFADLTAVGLRASPIADGAVWLIAASSPAPVSQFLDDLAWAGANPTVLDARGARHRRSDDELWEDYRSRPADYQALLAELLGFSGGESTDLDTPTLEKIRALKLDTSLLKPRLRLRGYQSFGARFAVVQGKVLLGDEMGLGKTIQALAASAHIAAVDGIERTRILVICPAAVTINWVREAEAFTQLPVFLAHGTGKEDIVGAWRSEGGYCIMTFDGARAMHHLVGAPEYVIVDEAHMVKNPQARRSVAVQEILGRAGSAILLTGTPIENRVHEFVTLIRYLNPALISEEESTMPATLFRQRIAPAYLRRNQADVLDELPEMNAHLDFVELNAADQEHYRDAVADSNWMAMRRAALTTPHGVPAKARRIADIVAEAADNGRKVVIFSYFLPVLERLEGLLGSCVIGSITGALAPAKRQLLVDELASAPGGSVLLAQIGAAGTGLNIQAASVVILAEPQVKPSIEAQAVARAHRMGQTSTVLVHRIVGVETVDERMMDVLSQKQAIFDAYARDSAAAEVPDAVDVSERALAEQIIAAERQRLGLSTPD
ncbi:DEAD/DEAH box helicase [Corynebacterium uterequi]|uniref:Helicase family protein n=1 Tax=Corynebacterium uterequi TaxID=1072256 RepID=A0A0G3HJD6_9CORY|nr:DEAD/DEAH box helicase [Corynebacterium uterequi]AKK11217.1 helicase family protein [Corynebacterium uterequi]